MGVEQQHVAIAARQLAQGLGRRLRIAVGGHAIGDVNHQRRITAGEAGHEGFEKLLGRRQGQTHRRSAAGLGLEPDGELEFLFEDAAGAVIDLAGALLDAQRVVRQRAHGDEMLPGQAAAECRGDRSAVSNRANVEIIANPFGLCALQDEVLKEPIDGVRHPLGFLFFRLPTERLKH